MDLNLHRQRLLRRHVGGLGALCNLDVRARFGRFRLVRGVGGRYRLSAGPNSRRRWRQCARARLWADGLRLRPIRVRCRPDRQSRRNPRS